MTFMFLVTTFKLDFMDSRGITTTLFWKIQGVCVCVRKTHCNSRGISVITVCDLVR